MLVALAAAALAPAAAGANHSSFGRVSAGAINGNGAFPAFFTATSADGARVLFQTREKLVTGDADDRSDVYRRSGGTTTQVSVGPFSGNGPWDAPFAGASVDGTDVFFYTVDQLVGGDEDATADIYAARVP